MSSSAQTVLSFWLEETSPEDRFRASDVLDAEIRQRFLADWEELAAGGLGSWLCGPMGALAYVLLADQLPRNMFRGDPRSFATDVKARQATKMALARGFDLRLTAEQRHFLYMPLMHSEVLPDQERGVRMVMMRIQGQDEILLHALCHRDVIRRFGRFPFRNDALGRDTTAGEAHVLESGGYGAVVRARQAAAAA